MTHPNVKFVNLSIPNHRIVKLPLLHKLIRLAGITDEAYREVYDNL